MSTLPKRRQRRITYSGTFDHLHNGHKAMIKYAAGIADQVIIGLTSQQMTVNKPLADLIQPYEIRYNELTLFIHEIGFEERISIEPIHDKFGFAVSNETLDSILVSTEKGPVLNAELINLTRTQKGLSPLRIFKHGFIYTEAGHRISSQSIREGIMLPDGQIINKDPIRGALLAVSEDLALPDSLRTDLKTPFGRLFKGTPDEAGSAFIEWVHQNGFSTIIAVGDVVTNTLIERRNPPQIAIIDNKTKRGTPIMHEIHPVHKLQVNNPPAMLTRDAIRMIYFAIDLKGQTAIVVDGEEDLLAIPAILLTRSSVVAYGQPDVGIVGVLPLSAERQDVFRIFKQLMPYMQ